jgi:hypothetical protein
MKVLMSLISRGILGGRSLSSECEFYLSSRFIEDVVELNVRTGADLPASAVAKSWH